MAEKDDWHLDRKVTLGLIFALLCNACGSVWWAARLDTVVGEHQQKLATLTASMATLDARQNSVNENLARIQEGQKYQTEMLRDMREQLKDKRP